MSSPIERIKLSRTARDQLIRMKRRTGIGNWNVLCRWALCASLAEPSVPPEARIPANSSVEMDWRTFGGEYEDVYMALLRQRCHQDGLGTEPRVLQQQFRLHLHRGVGYLAGNPNVRSIADLFGLLPAR